MNNPKEISSALVSKGAVLTLLDKDVQVLVGHWEWLDEHRVFYFEAGASDEFGGHLLEFDFVNAVHALGVAFFKKESEMIAYLAPIAESVNESDCAAYEKTFREWQHTGPELADFIHQVKQQLEN